MKRIRIAGAALALVVLLSCGAMAEDVKFEFDIPTIPKTPKITDIVNSSAVAGAVMKVYATIVGQEQMQACCGVNCDQTDCEMAQWWGRPDPTVVPNPPCIPNPNGTGNCMKSGNPKLFYYVNEVANTGPPVTMSYNTDSGKFEGEISLAGTAVGDIVYYYIVAVDGRGNVTSQLPKPDSVSCTSVTSWNASYETAATSNCTMMSSYERCSLNQTGTPTCGTSYSVNDPTGDTCGEPDANGNQSVVSGWQILDIGGYSASAGQGYGDLPTDDVVCTKIKLGAQPPQSGSGAIEGYLMIFFNPDIADPNPSDIHFPNAFAVSFAPKAEAIDANLAKVLWNGDCVTNPNTPDPLACKLFVGTDTETRLKIGFTNSELRFIAKNSLPNGKALIGSTSKSTTMVFLTGKIQLSGGTPFYVVDLTPGLDMLKDNRSATVGPPGRPAPPIVKSTTCQTGGVGTTSTCIKQGNVAPAGGNNCNFQLLPSPDKSFTNYYNVYYNTTNDKTSATLVATLSGSSNFAENGSALYNKTYNIPNSGGQLNGYPRYFFFSAVNTSAEPGQQETLSASWTSAVCTPEDWVAPAAPTAFSCATPSGQEEKCYCVWTADKTSDPSLYGFDIRRGGVLLNTLAILPNSYDDPNLVNATPYSYEVRSIDVGDNKSSWASTTCTPEDFKPPSKIEPSVVLQIGKYGVNVNWEPSAEEDMTGGGYNIYYCEKPAQTSCGADTGGLPVGYSKLNGTLVAHPAVPNPMSYSNDSAFGSEEKEWCFWVEACDNCKTASTCPSNTGANCSYFDTIYQYRKCIVVSAVVPDIAPLWPENQEVTADPAGQSCTLVWDQVCTNEEGAFGNCDYPEPAELVGYKIMHSATVAGSCDQLPTPGGGTPIKTVMAGGSTDYTHASSLLTNGTSYCYRVYAYNMFDKFSRATPVPATANAVICTPLDTTAPNKPDMIEPIAFDQFSCTPSWTAVTDKNSVTYDIHRCTGGWTTCNAGTKFTKINSSAMTALNYMDDTVSSETEYIYCATASDPSANTSAKYESTELSNCGYCYPSDKCLPPTAVEGFEIAPTYYGARAGWTNSTDDDGMGAGYHVYLCTSSNPSSCTTPYGRLTSSGPIPGAHDRQLGQDPKTFANIPVTSSGNYYIGVSYTGVACGESQIAVAAAPVNLETQDACMIDPDECPVEIALAEAFMGYTIATCNSGDSGCLVATGQSTGFKKVAQGVPGVQIEVVESVSKAVVKMATTDSEGEIPTFRLRTGSCSDCADPTKQYIVQARFTEGTWDQNASGLMGCAADSPAGECVVTLQAAGALSETAATSVKSVAAPDVSTAGGGDVGNPTCRPTVHVANLQPLKYRFGAFAGDAKYHPAVDFNMDGKISIHDLAVLKKNFGKPVPVSSSTMLCDPEFDNRTP
ncbi:MAG: hypothetical protein BWY28_03009 [bacterium ADurb.Bin236]|nr:MAG: hypothetical protein BWY28_03009 [bacterium ADurb.Bin236]